MARAASGAKSTHLRRDAARLAEAEHAIECTDEPRTHRAAAGRSDRAAACGGGAGVGVVRSETGGGGIDGCGGGGDAQHSDEAARDGQSELALL
jgi:hypothetical protein